MKTKSIKDAVHGYIQLEEPFWKVIDTVQFQRLKWLEQTSYRVLYPSARHDRFIHSIGTYFLGQKAFSGFSKNCIDLLKNDTVSEYKNAFLLACLLHDVGHAPFSHTCEDLFNYQEKTSDIKSKLNNELIKYVERYFIKEECETFKGDYSKIIKSTDGILKAPSPHEIMSAIITIINYDVFSAGFWEGKPQLDLIIRAILGCVYLVKRNASNDERIEKGIKNCLIRFLNSSTIDVDKLDYIARDTLMSGHENVALDNDRLLNSLSFVIIDKIYQPAFNKSALSVINNVIEAKNAQSKWIANHPVVLYESYLLRRAIGVSFDISLCEIFSSVSLSENGQKIKNNTFRLLSDIDIMYFMKLNISNEDVSEYFKRNERKSPIWKSHEEYIYCLGDRSKEREVADFFKPLMTYLDGIEDLTHPKRINDSLYCEINDDDKIYDKIKMIEILDVLKSYCADNYADFEFVVLPVNIKFSTEINGKQMFIRFGENEGDYATYDFLYNKDNKAIENKNLEYKFFYLYSKSKIESKHFLEYIYNKAHELADVAC